MGFNIEKLMQVAQPVPEKVKNEASYQRENKRWLRNSAHVALAVKRQLRINGITQQELANMMGLSAQYIGKILKGRENFTFETISKLEEALDMKLITVCNEDAKHEQVPQVVVLNVTYGNNSDWVQMPSPKSKCRKVQNES